MAERDKFIEARGAARGEAIEAGIFINKANKNVAGRLW
jgi:hypothetical protein